MNLRTLFLSFGFLLMTLTLATSSDNAFSASGTVAAKTRFCPDGQFAIRETAAAQPLCVSKPVFELRQQALKEIRSSGTMSFSEYKKQSLLTAQTQFEYDAINKSLQGSSGGGTITDTNSSSGSDGNKCGAKSCDPGAVLDTKTCTCKKAECTLTCSAGYVKDSVNCQCKTEKACSSYGCDNGGAATAVQVGDYVTCQCPTTTPPVQCIKKSCDAGNVFNMDSCKCEKIAGSSSGSGSSGGKCMRPAGSICSQGTVWSESACTCVAGGGNTDPNCSTQKKLQCQKAGGTLSHIHGTCMCTVVIPSGGSSGGSSTGGTTTSSTSSGGTSSSSSSSGGKTGSSGGSSSSSGGLVIAGYCGTTTSNRTPYYAPDNACCVYGTPDFRIATPFNSAQQMCCGEGRKYIKNPGTGAQNYCKEAPRCGVAEYDPSANTCCSWTDEQGTKHTDELVPGNAVQCPISAVQCQGKDWYIPDGTHACCPNGSVIAGDACLMCGGSGYNAFEQKCCFSKTVAGKNDQCCPDGKTVVGAGDRCPAGGVGH